MSMNLYVEVDGQKLDLWQTPTQITTMCLATKDGVAYELKGSKAKRALHCYRAWVQGSLYGSYKTMGECNEKGRVIEAHLKTIDEVIATGKKFKAYTL